MSTCQGNTSRIVFAGLAEQVTDWLFKEKLPYKVIIEKLDKEHNIKICLATLTLFRKSVLKDTEEFLAQDKDYKEKLAKQYLDTVENLMYAMSQIKNKIELFEDPKKWKQQSTYLNLLLTELHLLLKRSGEIHPTQIIENQVNMIQINQMVQGEIVRLIDEGQISLETSSAGIKEFYRKMKNANPV